MSAVNLFSWTLVVLIAGIFAGMFAEAVQPSHVKVLPRDPRPFDWERSCPELRDTA